MLTQYSIFFTGIFQTSMNTLILGDSFSADNHGWPSLLGFDVENRSQRGVGEYKVYKQYKAGDKHDLVIVCHTSPWRIHTPKHPVHITNTERPNTDFLLADIDYHSKENKEMEIVKEYWNNYYDFEYQIDIYKLLVAKLLKIPNSIHLTFHDVSEKIVPINMNHVWRQQPGNINHLDKKGNTIVAEEIISLAEKLTNANQS